MGIFDAGAKLKKTAQNLSDLGNNVKEKGIGAVAKDIANDTKDNITESIEQKKANAELAQQKKDEFKEEQEHLKQIFVATQKMGDIEIDDVNQLLKINNATENIKKNSKLKTVGKGILAMYTLGASIAVELALKPGDVIFHYNEITNYDLLENDLAVESGGLGRAVVGNAIAGPVGGILGSMTAKRKTKKSIDMLALHITTNNFCFPSIMISYIKSETKTKSSKYANALSQAHNTIACLNLIFAQNTDIDETITEKEMNVSNTDEPTSNPYEELKQLKELLDMGIISQEEFDQKKKELLKL